MLLCLYFCFIAKGCQQLRAHFSISVLHSLAEISDSAHGTHLYSMRWSVTAHQLHTWGKSEAVLSWDIPGCKKDTAWETRMWEQRQYFHLLLLFHPHVEFSTREAPWGLHSNCTSGRGMDNCIQRRRKHRSCLLLEYLNLGWEKRYEYVGHKILEIRPGECKENTQVLSPASPALSLPETAHLPPLTGCFQTKDQPLIENNTIIENISINKLNSLCYKVFYLSWNECTEGSWSLFFFSYSIYFYTRPQWRHLEYCS